MRKFSVRKIAFSALVAALYAALTLALGFISYGPIQFRIAEALCVLPFFFPFSVWGLFIGCVIANLISPYPLDIIVGSAATLLAAVCTMQIGRVARDSVPAKAIACIPPILIKAVFIGALIAYSGAGEAEAFAAVFALSGLHVGLGQMVVLYALGLPLLIYLPKSRVYDKMMEYYMK